MSSWNEVVQNHIIAHSDRVQKITQPLKDHFGIGYFTYHRIDDQGKYSVLLDRPEWAEYYVSSQIYLNDPYLRHPSVYQSGMTFIESFGSEEYRETVMKAGKQILDMDVSVLLIQKREKEVEFFGFSGNKNTCSLQNLHQNHPQLLASFAEHFKRQLAPVLFHLQEEAGSLITLKGQDFFCDRSIYPLIPISTRLAFYKDLGIPCAVENLSLRERQCLRRLLEAKSAKETALELGISPRTVEFYLEILKNKLSCWNKQDLLRIARELDSLGLL